jgi:Lecithin:cholesterol acyltransferase
VARKLMRDVIVCLPGITGSVLRKDGKDVWNVSGGALIGALQTLGGSITDLKLSGDSPEAEDLGDGITAPKMIRDIHLIPGIWKIDGYSKMLRYIEETFDVTRGRNLFEFPYDWRRDNRSSARRLARLGREWLNEWRKSSGAKNAKLVLVGHSMGGLISRYFLECLAGWRDTRTLVTFGTPYRGSVDALETLVNGHRIRFFDLTELARSFTSIHQLLPTYPCYDSGDGNLARVDEADIPHLDPAKAKAALDFHREIRDAVDEHLKDDEYVQGRYGIGRVVGIRQPTKQSGVRAGDKLTILKSLGGKDPSGDGTVPRPSATPLEFEGDEGAAFSAERHASLQNDDHVLLQLTGVLTGNVIDWSRFREAVPMIDVALDVDDLFSTADPVIVRAQPDDPSEELVAVAVDVETGDERARQSLSAHEEGWQEAELGPLPEAVYRVTVLGGGRVEPVSDLVTVLAE